MPGDLEVGYFQSLEISASSVTVHDQLHGSHEISEPVLFELLTSSALRRLIGVGQHGMSGLLGVTPNVTRFEHSVGAFLIVRKAGASVDEQIAALLHDISHTVLSHVMDWALSKPGESYHEVQKERYLSMTDLPAILIKHGYTDLKPFEEHLFPLVEYPAPHLCADRLDYAIRDTAAFGKLAVADAQSILASIKAFPNASSDNRFLVVQDKDLALKLSRAYLAADRDIWSNPAHVDISKRAGQLIGDMVRHGKIKEEVLWAVSDSEFWDLLRHAADEDGQRVIKSLEADKLPEETGLRLPAAAKVRTLNPDVYEDGFDKPLPLSEVTQAWADERRAYIEARQALRV